MQDSCPRYDGADSFPVRGTYNETPEQSLKPGLYLGLMHGRRHRTETLDGWGSNGPIIGPLQYVHTTYGQEIHLADEEGNELPDLAISAGMVEFDGWFYGDWTVFSGGRRERVRAARKSRRRD